MFIGGFRGPNNNNNTNSNTGENIPVMGANITSTNVNPRQETFPSFIKNFCCPNLVWKSFIFIITIIDIIIYIITLCYGIDKKPNELLAPYPSTLDSFGMKDPYKIYHGQVHRWLTFAFLHANFTHILSNVISQLIIGSYMETLIGSFKIALLYFLSSIGGGIFSSLISDRPGVGASVSIYGLFGAYIGFLFLNWNGLDARMGQGRKYYNLFFIMFIILLNLVNTYQNPMIDNWGHLGGLIYGFFLIWVLVRPYDANDGVCCSNRVWVIICWVALAFLYIGCLVMFYTLKK